MGERNTTARQDRDLGFLLRYENVAWFQEGRVRILDRRLYPSQISFVTCQSPAEVAGAIRDMVTQSAGPYTAAGMGMALAAWQSRGKSRERQIQDLEKAAHLLASARPTTRPRMLKITQSALTAAREGLAAGEADLSPRLFQVAFDALERRYARMARLADYLVSLFPSPARLMTYCYGETILGTSFRAAREKGIPLTLFCPESRPYLQGARLTASLAADMGVDVTVITDNMAGQVMTGQNIDLLTTAADAISREGYVVNKVGTLSMAILARHFGLPYYVTGIPDKLSLDQVQIEERDPGPVLEIQGRRHVKEGVKGYYPAFDITPPNLVSAVVTDAGILSPCDLDKYEGLAGHREDFYGGPAD